MTGEKGGLLAGLRAEALKSRHAAPVRLAVLMALPMPLLGAMPYRGVQIFSAWNYWYALFLPVSLSLVVACVARADARTRMRGLLGLGFPLGRAWWAKALWCLALCTLSNLVVFGIYLAGSAFSSQGLTAAGTLTMLLCALANTVTAAWMIPAGLFLTARLGMLAGIFCPLAAQLVGGFAWSLMPLPQLFPPSASMVHPHELHPRAAERRATRGGHGARRGAHGGRHAHTGGPCGLRARVRRAHGGGRGLVRALRGEVMAMTRLSDPTPRMTLPRALLSEALRLARSPLTAVHLVCGLAAGLACGEYFSIARWDPALGADAYAQFLGALMPLMSAIVCGLAVDEERAAGRLANLTAVPSRGRAVAAKLLALAALGAGALAVALGVFGAVLAVAGRLPLGPAPLAAAWAGIVLGSLPLYALGLGVALRLGRNAAIGAGAAGVLLAFFSVGGLAHGLMTGELTGALATPLSWVPLAWPARLGSLGVEAFIDAARAAGPLLTTALAGLVLTLATAAVLIAWFRRFEDGRADA